MSESNNNIPMRITQLEEATSYTDGMFYAVASASGGTKRIAANIVNSYLKGLNNAFIFVNDLAVTSEYKYFSDVQNGYINESNGITQHDSYKTYILKTITNTEVYFEDFEGSPFIAFAVYDSSGEINQWHNVIPRLVYRGNDETVTIPTKDNKININVNQYVAISVSNGHNFKMKGIGFVPISDIISDTNESIQNVYDEIVTKEEMPITLEYDNLTDVYNGYINSSSYVIVENGQYKTALLQVENECDVYFDGVHDASFLSIIVYDSTTLNQYHKVSDLLIYKDNGETNTLPYINNKLHVASGHYIAITVSINSDFYLYGTDLIIKKILNNDISIPETKEKTINVIKGGETFKIFIKSNNANDRYTRYTFKRMTVPSRSYDSWKLYSTDIVDKDENIIYSLSGNSEEEWEGAISEAGSSDFIGGYHGDEYYTGINCIIDGKIYSITDNFSLECNKITITVISYLNHCNTNTKVFDRVKTLVWTTEGMNIKNYYKAVDNININRAAIGMLSADKKYNNETQIDKMKNNYMGIIEDIPLNNTVPYGTMIEPDQAFIKGTFFGQNVYMSAIMKNYELTSHNYQGMFVDFVDRMKIYLEPIRNYEMSIGEYFMCETFYKIFAID